MVFPNRSGLAPASVFNESVLAVIFVCFVLIIIGTSVNAWRYVHRQHGFTDEGVFVVDKGKINKFIPYSNCISVKRIDECGLAIVHGVSSNWFGRYFTSVLLVSMESKQERDDLAEYINVRLGKPL